MIASLEAEAALVGCLLQGNAVTTRGYVKQLEASDFTDPRHEAVFTAMTQLVTAGMMVDPITVLGQLRRSGLEQTMTAGRDAGTFVADLMAAPPSLGTVGAYFLDVLEARVRREVEQSATRMVQAAPGESFASLIEVVNVEGAELTRQFTRLAARQNAERVAV